MAQETGELVEWNDARGFGFVRSDRGEHLFLHISEIARIANRPRIGDRLTFRRGSGRDGRPAAMGAAIAGANRLDRLVLSRGAAPAPKRLFGLHSLLGLAIIGLLVVGLVMGRLPVWLALAYAVLGLVCFATYGRDKALAQTGQWRVREASLHGLDLAGGIIGGLLGQQVFRHKTAKPAFIVVTALIALGHVLALAGLCVGLPV